MSLNQGNNWENMDASELSAYLDSRAGPWLFERYSYLMDNSCYLSLCMNSDHWAGLLRAFTLVKDEVPKCGLPRIIFSNGRCVDVETWIELNSTLQCELQQIE